MKRRLMFWVLLIAFAWLFVANFAEVRQLVDTLARGRLDWVIGSILVQIAYYVLYIGIYQAAFYTVEVRSRFIDLVPVVLGSLFVNTVAPSLATAGTALFVDDANRRGQPGARVAIGTFLMLVADFLTMGLIVVAAMIWLHYQHELHLYEILAAGFLVVLTATLTALIFLGVMLPDRLRRLLGWVRQAANRAARLVRRPPVLADGWDQKTAGEFIGAGQAITRHPGRLLLTLGVALASHLVHLASVYTLFLAFRQPVSFGTLVAGFAIGMLFWIVAITPQGIGVVEGAMALVYTSLGIPGHTATVIALTYRGLTFWLPMMIGFVLLQRVKSFQPDEKVPAEPASVRLASALTGATGILNVVLAVQPPRAERLSLLLQWLPPEALAQARLVTALAGCALLVLAYNLWRRKRAAWLLTLPILLVSASAHIARGLGYEEAILAVLLAAWLFLLRSHFHAHSDAPALRGGLASLAYVLLFTLSYGALGLALLEGDFRSRSSLALALQRTLAMFNPFHGAALGPVTDMARSFAISVYQVGAVTTAWALARLVRSLLRRPPATDEERARARDVVRAWGSGTSARLALLDDKSCYFSPGGSLVPHVVRGRVALALGNPIGPGDDLAAAIAAYRLHCRSHGWQAVFHLVPRESLPLYGAAGLEPVTVGREAVLDLAARRWSPPDVALVQAADRLLDQGCRAEIVRPPLQPLLLSELRMVSDRWLSDRYGSEPRFALSWFDEERLRLHPVAIVRSPAGALVSFAGLEPDAGRQRLAVAMVRHSVTPAPGTLECLYRLVVDWSTAEGYKALDLGLAPQDREQRRRQGHASLLPLNLLEAHLASAYAFLGGRDFVERFRPDWQTVYLVHGGDLWAAVVALVSADTGEPVWWSHLKLRLMARWKRQTTRRAV